MRAAVGSILIVGALSALSACAGGHPGAEAQVAVDGPVSSGVPDEARSAGSEPPGTSPPSVTPSTALPMPGGPEQRAPTVAAWERTDLVSTLGDVAHVTDVLVTADQRLVVGFYRSPDEAGVASASTTGGPWSVDLLAGADQLRDLVELPDGTLLATGTAGRDSAIVWRDAGGGWTPVGRTDLPNPQATNGWDLEVLSDGSVLLATDSLANDPLRPNPSVHRSVDGGVSWSSLAPLPGLGVLALTETATGTILAATEDSDEHDDADAAGQARVYASTDGGATWGEGVELADANRVYDLVTLHDGTIWAGTGIRGEILESTDGGGSWRALAPVPPATARRGEGAAAETVTLEASRVYRVLELDDGSIVVGTGNQGGDVFVTADRGRSWVALPETGPNNVVWGLAQSSDGRLWVGTGSSVGDLLVGTTG